MVEFADWQHKLANLTPAPRNRGCPAGDPCPATGCPACCPPYDPCNKVNCNSCGENMAKQVYPGAEGYGGNANDPLDVPIGDETVQEHRDRMNQKPLSNPFETISVAEDLPDMLRTVDAAMGVHSTPGLLYVTSDRRVVRADWERVTDPREREILAALLRVATGINNEQLNKAFPNYRERSDG